MGTRRFERSEAYAKYHELFALETLLAKHGTNFVDYHSYTKFKQHFETQVSATDGIIEYNQRFPLALLNFFAESSKTLRTSNHLFESAGDVRTVRHSDIDGYSLL
jgi:hypothetical protein